MKPLSAVPESFFKMGFLGRPLSTPVRVTTFDVNPRLSPFPLSFRFFDGDFPYARGFFWFPPPMDFTRVLSLDLTLSLLFFFPPQSCVKEPRNIASPAYFHPPPTSRFSTLLPENIPPSQSVPFHFGTRCSSTALLVVAFRIAPSC